ncbi:MAG: zinc-dependent metalloprotease [Fimbriimonadaceae bacterium]|nr:zinc-dependent metalloprotease [Fimbriimonadaceae bacterium]
MPLSLILAASMGLLQAQALPSTADAVKGLEKRTGLIENYIDKNTGKLYLKLPAPKSPDGLVGEYLYAEGMTTGMGSNDISLDRGEGGDEFIIRIRIRGAKAIVEAVNTTFRASNPDEAERQAAAASFPTSVMWSGNLTGRDADGTTVVDFTDFLVRDAHGSAQVLSGYSLDMGKSFLMPESCFSFPKNLEFDAQLTFTGQGSRAVGETTPNPKHVSLVQHHSLVELPDTDGFKPRFYDPRMGYFGITYYDFSAPLDKPLLKRLIARHRLEKVNPGAAPSPVKKPVVYYLDRGTPEPIRSALIEGASWWAKAFEEAGYLDAFKVEIMPADMHPLDIRYNVIQWIHRSTRGYSVGGSFTDPRTGEILKGAVRLDSSRGRQDMKIFEGLMGTDKPDELSKIALMRIRQLSAHEVGHTLGLRHNFAASTYGGRASVMDYPAPLIVPKEDGSLDLSNAYGVGVGDWDKFAIKLGYADFGPGVDEVQAIRAELQKTPLLYLTDDDAPGSGGADWRATRFDNGNDPVADLLSSLAVRKIGLDRFDQRNLRDGEPRSELEEVLGPVYFYHRYSLDAALKVIGGVMYTHTVKDGGLNPPMRVIGAENQREALQAVFKCIDPANLDLPHSLFNILNPRAPGYGDSREKFKSNTTYVFDALGAANTAADMVLAELLSPIRAVRMVELRTREGVGPMSLDEMLQKTTDFVFGLNYTEPRTMEISRGIQAVYLERLLDLADANVPRNVRSRVMIALGEVKAKLTQMAKTKSGFDKQMAQDMLADIERFLTRPAESARRIPKPLAPLPGSPIGCCGG